MKTIILSAAFSFSLLGGSTENFNIKEIDKSMAKVSNNFYASKTEVSNAEYNLFVSALKANDDKALISVAEIDASQWKKAASHYESYAKYYSSHPAYQDYPVVNISHEGAELFCQWLTDEYNKDPKRKFHKVIFRLPSEAEWLLAAKGVDPEAIYPWKGTALQNKKGRYNCNFKRPGENEMGQPGELIDGADVTAPVLSYSPNAFGLYNMSGNVAEMLTIKGRTKGGSWLDEAEFIDIDANQSEVDSDAPSPTVGFRYFMEVLEK